MWFAKIKRFYDGGFWTKEMVYEAVGYGKIIAKEYKEITGEDYE